MKPYYEHGGMMALHLCPRCYQPLSHHSRPCTDIVTPREELPVLPAAARERYVSAAKARWGEPDRVASFEDFLRASWDSGFLAASRKAPT